MLDFTTARTLLIEAARPIERRTTLPIEACLGRVLAADARALSDSPPSDVSTLDGYAFATCDLHPDGVTRLRVSQRIAAGQVGSALGRGEAARIFTGAPLPAGADAIIAQEFVQRDGDMLVFTARPHPYEDVRRQGADFHAQDILVPAKTRLGPAHLGLIASGGSATIEVFDRLQVALLTSGDEVVPPGQPLAPGHIYNANAALLQGLLERLGCTISHVEHLADDLSITQSTLARLADECDVILSVGGVSVGEEDHIKAAIERLGHIDLWKVRIKPGKPFAFGHIGNTPFLGLPGNPVSAFVTFLLFAKPFLLARMGAHVPPLRPLHLPAAFARPLAADRREFARARITAEQRVELYGNQNSGILSSLTWADALAEIPEHVSIAPGDLLPVHLLAELLA